MTIRQGIYCSLFICMIAIPQARALVNLNEGTDLVLLSSTFGVGYDSNVFTRASAKSSLLETAAASMDYNRQAGMIGVSAKADVTSGHFENVRDQDYVDPSLALAFRKRDGRTTGTFSLQVRRESQADPDAGARTHDWNDNGTLDLRYPVNDRYYFTNSISTTLRDYSNNPTFSDLTTYSDSIALNYIYTSKLDLNSGYALSISDTSLHTRAYDQSFTVGATGGILPKLSGTIRFGVERRDNDSPLGGRETFDAFTSGTSLKWQYSRKISFAGDLTEDFSTTSTNLPVNRTTAGLRATANVGQKIVGNVGVIYMLSDFLGETGNGRTDRMLQIDASVAVAITSNLRAILACATMVNSSNVPVAAFNRTNVTCSISATY